MATTKGTGRQEWPRRVEASTASQDAVLETAGRKAYARLPAVERLELCREIVKTRRRELCLAYENVVMVTAGFKERRSARTGRVRFIREPCVIFVVRRKWARRPRQGHPQALPRTLLAYPGGRTRALCSVPTDVITEKRIFAARRRTRPNLT